MNIEHNQNLEIEENAVNLNEFTNKLFKDYVNNEELLEKNVASDFKEIAFPYLVETINKIIDKEYINLQLGGSAAEIISGLLSPDEYWYAKYQIKKSWKKIEENCVVKDRGNTISSAINLLANGDSDFDLWVDNKDELLDIFNLVYEQASDKEIEILNIDNEIKTFEQNISENINLMAYYGPVYKGSSILRVHLQLKDENNNSIFHIDITNLPETGNEVAKERRYGIGDIHDKCIWKIKKENNKLTINIPKESVPHANEQSKLDLENKDIKTNFEIVLRESRKKLTHFCSKNNYKRYDFKLSNVFPLIDIENIFYLKELTSSEENKVWQIYENQSPYQKQMIYQELFLMSQIDPYLTIIFLQDTGMDSLFFGRHLLKKEVVKLLNSPYLNFSINSSSKKVEDKIINSREKYLSIKLNDENRNGMERFICAVGQVFCSEKDRNNYEIHLKKGLEILSDPRKKIKKPEPIKTEKFLNTKEKDILTQLEKMGGLTEKGLHHVLQKEYPDRYPNIKERDRKKFKKTLFELKKTGLVETLKRNIKTYKGEKELWFYYPCSNSTRIEKILYDVGRPKVESKIIEGAYKLIGVDSLEAAISIKVSELKEFGIFELLISYFHPTLILKLVTWDQEIKKRKDTHDHIDFSSSDSKF